MTPVDHATAAAEHIRLLNHETQDTADGYAYPADVNAMLAELWLLMIRMPQAIDQAVAWLERADQEGRVGDDRWPLHQQIQKANLNVADAVVVLRHSIRICELLATSLDQAREHTSHMTGLPGYSAG